MLKIKKILNASKKLPARLSSWRWVIFPGGRRLHRVSKLDIEAVEKSGETGGPGETVCGRRGTLIMPGVLSRMGLPRCHHCCRMISMPDGLGNPRNDKTLSRIAQR